MSGVELSINGVQYKVTSGDASISLSDFIRRHAHLTGTKVMCHEGGCGACIVAATILHPITKQKETIAVNSCLISLFSCHNWEITTIEGIGNRFDGYHQIQKTLAQFNATQCGFCSPGFVMNMFCLSKTDDKQLTMKEIENSFGSNICRCTGYRSIADAFKSLAEDAGTNLQPKISDIEDLSQMLSSCKLDKSLCLKECDKKSYLSSPEILKPLNTDITNITWFKVYSIKDIFSIFEKYGVKSYRLVSGNTAQGVYDFEERIHNTPEVMIDISSVTELKNCSRNANLILGGNMTITEVMNVLDSIYKEDVYFHYAEEMVRHMKLIAHIPVRNVGSIAGNLMIKHKDNRFPSDIFLLFETIGASLTIIHKDLRIANVSLTEFLELDMIGNIIHSVNLPEMSECYFKTYKIMKRSSSTYASVNAGFLLKINTDDEVTSVRIVYGGIHSKFIHASTTEKFLLGRNVFQNDTIKSAIKYLCDEIFPDDEEIELLAEYRKLLAIGLFYKFILYVNAFKNINNKIKSGGTDFERPLSQGKQEFDTDQKIWPLNKPIPKIKGLEQCAGEAAFVCDIPQLPNEVFATFVLSNLFNGEIDIIDGTEALSMKGVYSVLTHKDIPGMNSFTPLFPGVFSEAEEILCSGKVKYHGQPVALVVAATEKLANAATLKVKVSYKNTGSEKPLLSIRDVLKNPIENHRIQNVTSYTAENKGSDVEKVIKGTFECAGQYHFTMETQSCICVPSEDGIDVYSATQWVDWTQKAISEALKIPQHRINMKVHRLGGAFGSKICRSIQIATACSLACLKLSRPVRLIMPLESNMMAIGKRLSCLAEYEVGVDKNGKINYLNNTFYENVGCSQNENSIIDLSTEAFSNIYDKSTWTVSGNGVVTDIASNTYFRGPGTFEGVSMIEHIMEHISHEVGRDPIEVRVENVSTEHKNNMMDIITKLKESSEYLERKKSVEDYNINNRWKKKGISLMPMRFNIIYYGSLSSFVSVFHGDGSVAVSCGGIEVGQGIYTKITQVAAHTLGIPLEKVIVKPVCNVISPNVMFTGGSVTSEQCCFATKKACEIILERLTPLKTKNKDSSWEMLVEEAYNSGINLSAQYLARPDEFQSYNVYGAVVTEVEADMLIGSHQVLRVDILEDSGLSINPELDVGQAEGAFVQGLGYWTTEELKYSMNTGKLLTNRTWNYSPPLMKDIPVDFRIKFIKNLTLPDIITRAKTACEPPIVLSYSVVLAIRQAIASARKDSGLPDRWFDIDMPLSPEHMLLASDVNIDQFQLLSN